MLELPCRGSFNENLQSMLWSKKHTFYYIKVVSKGLYISHACYPVALLIDMTI